MEEDEVRSVVSREEVGEGQETEDRWISRPSTIAGLLNLADGVLKLLSVFGLLAFMKVVDMDAGRSPKEAADLLTVLGGITALLVASGFLAFAGGGFALQRRKWGLALAGAIVALVPNVPLGALSLVMLMRDRKKFE